MRPLHRTAATVRRLFHARRPTAARPVQAVLSRPAPLALPPPPRRLVPAAWTTPAGYVVLAKQALKCLGSASGGHNRVAATMTRELWQARDPAAELDRLQQEAHSVLRLLGDLRREQARQDDEANRQADDWTPGPWRVVVAQRGR